MTHHAHPPRRTPASSPRPCDTRASLFRLPRLCQALGLPESEGPDAAVALAVLCGNDFDKKGGKGVGPEEAFRALGALARSRGEQRDGGVLTVGAVRIRRGLWLEGPDIPFGGRAWFQTLSRLALPICDPSAGADVPAAGRPVS